MESIENLWTLQINLRWLSLGSSHPVPTRRKEIFANNFTELRRKSKWSREEQSVLGAQEPLTSVPMNKGMTRNTVGRSGVTNLPVIIREKKKTTLQNGNFKNTESHIKLKTDLYELYLLHDLYTPIKGTK